MSKIDKEIAEGLLARLMNLNELKVIHTNLEIGCHHENKWSFQIDDFDMSINEVEGPARIFGIPVASDKARFR